MPRLLQRLAQGRSARPWTQRQSRQADRRQDQQIGAGTAPDCARFDRPGAKDQRWDVERQDEERQHDALTPSPQAQRRSDAADQAERRGADQQAGKQCRDRTRIEIDQQREKRAGQRQRQAGRHPMRGAFCKHRKLEREARKGQQIELAILIIRLEQPVERQQSREQCRHPDDAGADALQDLRLGTDAEREQHDSQNKEPDDKTGVAALAQREAQIAPKEAEKRRHRQPAAAWSDSGAKASRVMVAAAPMSIGVWLATTTRPPEARCSAIACSRRDWFSWSSALAGSSRSQIDAGAATRRASATRRRWPAESQRHGQSATRSRANAASAASRRRGARLDSVPRSAAQNARVSRGVRPGFTPS